MGGGGGSQPSQPTTTTVQNTNIPEYAQPYVETMLGATQQQLFNTAPNASGGVDITGIKPYVPYSQNPQDYVAGFSPMQQQAQQGVAGLTMPGEFGQAAGLTGAASMGSMGAGRDYARMATSPYAMGAYMNPYVQESLAPQLQEIQRQADLASNQAASQATAAGAFGGTRGQLAQAEAQRAGQMAKQQAIGQGYNQAFNQAQQAMQYGAGLGLQGYGQALQGAGQLANIGSQGLQAQQGIYGLQNQYGTQQQQQQQNIINQAIQNYATAQQYPQQQLAFMNSMLRGLPLQTSTTQMYQAAPSTMSQLGGLAATGIGAYGAMGGFKAKGGAIKEKKFDVGGAVTADLENMDDAHLMQQAKTSPSAMIRAEAARILAEHRAAQGITGAQSNLNFSDGGILDFQPVNTDDAEHEYAGGGIIAFDKGGAARIPTWDEVTSAMNQWQESQAPWYLPTPKVDASKGKLEEYDRLRQAYLNKTPLEGLPALAAKAPPTETPSAKVPPSTSTAAKESEGPGIDALSDKENKSVGGKYEAQIQKLMDELGKGLKTGKSQADLDELRQEIKGKQDQKFWMALMKGGAEAMAGTSQHPLTNIAKGVSGGIEDLAKSETAERADKKLLVQQQAALEQAEYARKTGNLNALIAAQTRIDNINSQRAQLGIYKEMGILNAREAARGKMITTLMTQGMNEEEATAIANRAYPSTIGTATGSSVKTIPFASLGKK